VPFEDSPGLNLGVPVHGRSLAADEARARKPIDCRVSWNRIKNGAQEIALLDDRILKLPPPVTGPLQETVTLLLDILFTVVYLRPVALERCAE